MSLRVGFSRIDITPPMGIEISGYFYSRRADGVLDPLEANTAVFENDGKYVVVMSCDLIDIPPKMASDYQDAIAARFGIPRAAIFIACTHTHTGPLFGESSIGTKGDPQYEAYLRGKLGDAVLLAMNDLTPATLSISMGEAKGIAFIRRYRMKDGTVKTNPGIGNPNIAHPLDTVNEEVRLVKITREGTDDIYLVNFGVHPDVISGCKISADWPGFVRETVEAALPGVKCIMLNGFEGDVNHVNTASIQGDWDVRTGYAHAKRMGRTIAGAVLQLCDCTKPVEGNAIAYGEKNVYIPANAEPDKVEEARAYLKEHEGKPVNAMESQGMNGVRALRILALENGPTEFEAHLSAVSVGDVVFGGIAGEPFTQLGNRIRAASPFGMTVLCCCTNGGDTYYPTSQAYEEGGYEANTSRLAKGGDNIIVDGMNTLIASLKA